MTSWDDRFNTDEYVYGKEPNEFIVSAFADVPAGRVLNLAAGEGRNAVYLAGRGHAVVAVDSSAVGLEKARALAAEHKVTIETIRADLTDFEIEPESFDAITCIFCHLPPAVRKPLLRRAVGGLRPGGRFVLELFTPRQLAYDTGGPKDPELLAEPDDLKRELDGLEFEHALELVREFKEGSRHTGPGAVFQVIGLKPGAV